MNSKDIYNDGHGFRGFAPQPKPEPQEVVFSKVDGCWESGAIRFARTKKAGDVNSYMKEHHPGTRVGFKASDLGPVVAAECAAAGFGDVLWMK